MSSLLDISGTLRNYFTLNNKATIHQGNGEPSNDLGNVSDIYIDLSNGCSYIKEVSNQWKKIVTETQLSTVFVFKGSKEYYSQLPTSGNKTGDIYNIINADVEHGINAGDNVAWEEDHWEKLGGVIDLSKFKLGNLSDVSLTNLVDGQGIKYDAQSGQWINGEVGKSVVATIKYYV